MLISQPSSKLPLQSEEPVAQLAIRHAPMLHAAAPFATLGQALPQVPQSETLILRSTQVPLQQPKVPGQPWVGVQPG